MRTICTLLAVLLVFGPLGMGILFNVDAPEIEGGTPYSDGSEASFEDHGTRGEPLEDPNFVNLYLYGNGNVINTTAPWSADPDSTGSTTTFTLDFALSSELWAGDPLGDIGLRAYVYLTGSSLTSSAVTVTVMENDGGTQVGQGNYEYTSGSDITPTLHTIDIAFETQHNHNYNFSQGNVIAVEFSFSGSGTNIYFDSENTPSSLRIYCKHITDIGVVTKDFLGIETQKFYPKNIDLVMNRRQVEIWGPVTDAFGSYDVKNVSVVIDRPLSQGSITKIAYWDRGKGEYNYTWNYPSTSKAGLYEVITHVTTLQGQEYTYSNNFTMSEYGVLLTSPSQEQGEGYPNSRALKKVIQDETANITINVWNIGANTTSIDIDTLGNPSWSWELGAQNIVLDPGKTSGTVENVAPGNHVSIVLIIDAEGKDLHEYVSIRVEGTCTEDTDESGELNTRTTVGVKFDVELEFVEGNPESQTQNAEIGSEVYYDFIVKNEGGQDDYISLTISTPPAGWTWTLEGESLQTGPSQYGDYYVYLESDKQTPKPLTLTLGTPSTGGDDEVVMTITGKSWGSKDQGDDVVESDMITATTILTTGVKLEVVNEPERTTDPEDQVTFELRLTNTGIASANLTVTFTQPDSDFGWSQGDISFSSSSYQNEKDFSNLAPDSPQSFSLFVEPSFEVQADNYTIDIKAYRNDAPQTRFDEKSVYCIITEITEIDAYPTDMSGEAEPGEDVEYSFTIENNGNVKELVTIQVEEPGGWEVDFGESSSDWLKEIDPQDSEIVTVRLSIPDDAAGDETVDITISVVPVERPDDLILIETHTKIKGSFTQTIFTLLVPILLLIVIIIMVIVIYRRR